MAWGLVIDPTSEDASNVQTDINDGTIYRALEPIELPEPEKDPRYVRVDEGELPLEYHYENRVISIGLRVYGTSAVSLATRLGVLTKKVAKINREGGTLRVTTPSAALVVYDLLSADIVDEFDSSFGVNHRAEVELQFTAKPFGRGPTVQQADRTETTLPALVAIETGILGDVPGLGRLVVDNDVATDQWFLQWGIESRYFDTADPANKKLFFQAEALTALSGSSSVAGPTGSSGTNVIRNTNLTTTYQAILSTQLTGGGAHLGHVGTFRVFARLHRPTGNTGAIDVALEWAEGDFRRFTRNDAVSFAANEREGVFTHTDLGLVHLTKVAQGTQRWEGRIIARSTIVGDELDVDCLYLFPVAEGYGEVRISDAILETTTATAQDEFLHTSGNLVGKTALAGGNWITLTSPGDPDDFTINTTEDVAERAAAVDGGPRVDLIDHTAIGATVVEAELSSELNTAGFARTGVVARGTVGGNFVAAFIDGEEEVSEAGIYLYTAGSLEILANNLDLDQSVIGLPTGAYYRARLYVQVSGRLRFWVAPAGQRFPVEPMFDLSDSRLATGGTHATGKTGLFDFKQSTGTKTRKYRHFVSYTPPADAVIFASQSLELRHDRVIREDSGGTIWNTVTPDGTYLLIPPAGNEARQARFILKASRGLPEDDADSAIDDISARLTYTPRYLQLPAS